MQKNDAKKNQHLTAAFPLIGAGTIALVLLILFLGMKYPDAAFFRFLPSGSSFIFFWAFVCGGIFFLLARFAFLYIDLTGLGEPLNKPLPKNICNAVFFCASAVVLFLLARRRLISEYTEYPARDIPLKSFHLIPPALAVLLIGLILIFYYQTFFLLNQEKWLRILTAAAYLFSIVFCFFGHYQPVIDKGSSFDVHHGAAYLQTIFNVLYFTPYDQYTSGVYGHYGLFYAAAMKLFRLPADGVFYLIALAGALTAVFGIYVIHKTVRSHMLRIISAVSLAVPYALIYNENYWQGQPHRTLFPMMILAYFVFINDHQRFKPLQDLGAYFIAFLSVVWNTETGIMCSLAVTIIFILRDWQNDHWAKPILWLRYILYFLGSVLAIAAAIALVYGYNAFCAQRTGNMVEFQLNDFFFPLFTKSYMSEGIVSQSVVFGNHAWLYGLALFTILILRGFSQNSWCIPGLQNRDRFGYIDAAVGIFGLAGLTVYFKTAAYGKLSLILQPAVIGMARLCFVYFPVSKRFTAAENIKDISKSVFSFLNLIVLAVLSAEIITMGPIAIGNRNRIDHGKSDIRHLASVYNTVVPPDTFSIGSLVDLLNYQLHQDSGAHYRDLSDLNVGGPALKQKIASDALERDQFAVWNFENREMQVVKLILEKDNSYHIVNEIDLGGYPLQLYSH